MKEESSISPPMIQGESEIQDESDIDVVSLLKRMQQQLLFLEKKIDLLISRSQQGPSGERTSRDRPFRKGSFSKPFRSFDRPQHGKGEFGRGPREKDTAQGHFYEHRPGEKSRGPSPKKRQFPFKRKDRE